MHAESNSKRTYDLAEAVRQFAIRMGARWRRCSGYYCALHIVIVAHLCDGLFVSATSCLELSENSALAKKPPSPKFLYSRLVGAELLSAELRRTADVRSLVVVAVLAGSVRVVRFVS